MWHLITALLTAALLAGYGYAAYEIGGAVSESKWLARDRDRVSKLLKEKREDIESLTRIHELKEESTMSLLNEKNKEYEALQLKYFANKRKPGELRVSSKVCRSPDRTAANSDASVGVSRPEEPAEVRLPMQIEDGLWSIMYDGDYVKHLYDRCRQSLVANNLLR